MLRNILLLLVLAIVSCETSKSGTYAALPIHILLDGTSSSGKSTVSKLLHKHGFVHLAIDDFWVKGSLEESKFIDTKRFYGKDERKEFFNKVSRKIMFEEGTKHNLVVYDDIDQSILSNYKQEDSRILVVVLYASLNQLVKNVVSRRLYDPRGKLVFEQFADRYIIAKKGENSIDSIDKLSFASELRNSLKYEFESENKLSKFVDDIFERMGIKDDKVWPIKLREKYCSHLIINSGIKSPAEIFKQIMSKGSKSQI